MTDNNKKATISKVVVSVGDTDVSLALDQVRELKAALDELLSERVVRESYPVYVPSLPYAPYQPCWYSSGTGYEYRGDAVSLSVTA